MYVTKLALRDFRSYAELELSLEPGVSAFVGPNGQGKTNLVEAIGFVSTLASHRVASDAALVRAGATSAVVRLRARRADRETQVEIEINPGRANRAHVNRSPVRRTRDVLGIVRTVVFAPEDLALVKGDPEGRRRFLDGLLVQVSPRMSGVLADYDRVLRQRNALLKSAGPGMRRHVRVPAAVPSAEAVGPDDGAPASGGPGGDPSTLDVWDAKLAELGAEILAARLRLAGRLRPHVTDAYERVSDGGLAALGYRSSLAARESRDAGYDDWLGEASRVPADGAPAAVPAELPHDGVPAAGLAGQLLDALRRLRRKELERGVTLVGPHRDDVLLGINDLPAKGYASHGESWSLALALRLGSFELLSKGDDDVGGWGEGATPVLVLDDVFAELDNERRDRLARFVAGAEQVLVTAAVPADVPDGLAGARFEVAGGKVHHG